MTTTAKIGPCCEGARRIEAQDMLLEYWCPDHGKTLPRPRDPATTSGSPSSPTYNHTRGDSALNPCRACFDAQTPDERWAALANAASEAENVRRSLRVALHALRYLRGAVVNAEDAKSVAETVIEDLSEAHQVQELSDAEEATATFRASVPDPRGGPFPPSPWGSHSNVGISPAKIFEAGFAAAWPEDAPWPDDPNIRTRAVELADAIKKAGLA